MNNSENESGHKFCKQYQSKTSDVKECDYNVEFVLNTNYIYLLAPSANTNYLEFLLAREVCNESSKYSLRFIRKMYHFSIGTMPFYLNSLTRFLASDIKCDNQSLLISFR